MVDHVSVGAGAGRRRRGCRTLAVLLGAFLLVLVPADPASAVIYRDRYRGRVGTGPSGPVIECVPGDDWGTLYRDRTYVGLVPGVRQYARARSLVDVWNPSTGAWQLYGRGDWRWGNSPDGTYFTFNEERSYVHRGWVYRLRLKVVWLRADGTALGSAVYRYAGSQYRDWNQGGAASSCYFP